MSYEDEPRYQLCKVCGAKDCDCTMKDLRNFQAGAASRDAEVAKWKAAEHSLSDAYLRLRGLLDAFDTPRGVTAEQVWEHTEGKLIDLISERDQLRAKINVLRCAIRAVQ